MGNVITRNSRTDKRRVFILGGKVGYVTHHEQLFKVKRAKVKVTRSRDVSAVVSVTILYPPYQTFLVMLMAHYLKRL